MQQTDNSRKARDRMAAGRGGGLSATIFKEVDGLEFGDNLGVIKAPVGKEEDGKHYSKSRRRILTILRWISKYMGE